MWIKYSGARTKESIVLEFAHVKYEFSEKNGYVCEIPNELFAHIITPDKIGTFIPCDAPVKQEDVKGPQNDALKEEPAEALRSKTRGRPKGR